eukprot:TRINITY_DN3842_c1_g1_i1.p1 TRINITY_DN3842_c1_g1~~TRINITY_DN3842_c1_g1_i1.p1  ORF type:complete len:468 (-),score=58.32 TRINITY_DN3842_c1_g1_i1:394-1797(-)
MMEASFKGSIPLRESIVNLIHLAVLPAIWVAIAQLVPIDNQYVFSIIYMTALYETAPMLAFILMHYSNYPPSILGEWAKLPALFLTFSNVFGFFISAALIFIVSTYLWSIGPFLFFLVCIISVVPEHFVFFLNQLFARKRLPYFTEFFPTEEQLELSKISDTVQFWVVLLICAFGSSYYVMAGFTYLFSGKSSISSIVLCYIAFSVTFSVVQFFISMIAKKVDFHMGKLQQAASFNNVTRNSFTTIANIINIPLEGFDNSSSESSRKVSTTILIKDSSGMQTISPNNFKFYSTIADVVVWTRYQMVFRTVFFLSGELNWERFVIFQLLETAFQIILYPLRTTDTFVKLQKMFFEKYVPSAPLQDDLCFRKSVGVSMVTRQVGQLTTLLAFTLSVTLMRYCTHKTEFYPFLSSIIDPTIHHAYYNVMEFAAVSFLVETIRSVVLTLIIKRMVHFNPFMNFQKGFDRGR